ncbi:MAG: polysaccharide ABC transporter ATP-binding protein [Anaerolineaceae bacterium]|nr:polysaccharide ABC transporter ATP-binding protein [Anaerolineaceae bacterium]
MSNTVISIEDLSKAYRLGQIGTGTLTNDLKVWWAKKRGLPNPMLRIGQYDNSNLEGETLWALKNVSFQVEQGDVLGIIGRNGAGKSTLLKILSRVTAPTSGIVKVKGRIASLLEVGTGFHPDLTGRENIYLNGAILGMSKEEIKRKFDEIVYFAEIAKFIDTPVKRYSSGMFVRLAFAVAAHLDPEILVVDEVLAVGDAEFQKKCLGKMGSVAKEGRTVLFVSHNMEAILNLCPCANVFERGEVIFSGRSEESVKLYLNHITQLQSNSQPNVIFERQETQTSEPIFVNKIEVFDAQLQPKPTIYTWDALTLRVHYYSNRPIKSVSYVIDIFDYKQQRLAVFDSGLKLSVQQGFHYIDCYIPQMPLSAGEFILGAGFTLPGASFIWRKTDIAIFRINGKDVFDIARPPVTTRMLIAIPHEWKSD